MPTMLPSTPKTFGDIRHVFSSCLSAVLGLANPLNLQPVKQAVCILVDGLGAHNIRERAGHAPYISGLLSHQKPISAGFPTTTATSITSFGTGLTPGEHGIVGYRIQDPETKTPVNLLSGWNGTLVARDWQVSETLSQKAKALGVTTFFIGAPEYENSGFTSITMPEAVFVPATSIDQAFREATNLLSKPERSLIYLYVPQLDQSAHAFGWSSARWSELLEQVDSGLQQLSKVLKKNQGVCLTSDHGIVDVPVAGKVFLDELPQPKSGFSLVGGDTRAPMLYLNDPSEAEEYANVLRSELGSQAWVLTKSELIQTGWYGNLAEGIDQRLSEIFVLARSRIAFYHRKFASPKSINMIGHHGSLTSEELQIPLLRLGQFY